MTSLFSALIRTWIPAWLLLLPGNSPAQTQPALATMSVLYPAWVAEIQERIVSPATFQNATGQPLIIGLGPEHYESQVRHLPSTRRLLEVKAPGKIEFLTRQLESGVGGYEQFFLPGLISDLVGVDLTDLADLDAVARSPFAKDCLLGVDRRQLVLRLMTVHVKSADTLKDLQARKRERSPGRP